MMFPKPEELKNLRLLFFPRGLAGLELICYGIFILLLLFLGIYGGVFSFLAGIIFIAVGFQIQIVSSCYKKENEGT